MTATSPAAVEGRAPATPLARPTGSRANGWWGMVLLIATEATLFAVLIAAYFYIRFKSKEWPQDGLPGPDVARAIANNGVLFVSLVPMVLAERAVARGRQGLLKAALAGSFLLGLAYFALQYDSFNTSWHVFKPSANTYASLVYTIVGAHWIHVGVGLLVLLWIQSRAWLGHFGSERNVPVQVAALYWYFVAVLAIPVLLTILAGAV